MIGTKKCDLRKK